MVDFNDRRPDTFPGLGNDIRSRQIADGVGQHMLKHPDVRVNLEFNGADGIYRKSGYLRPDEAGNPQLFHNARSSKAQPLDDLRELRAISGSRRDRVQVDGERSRKTHDYWARWSPNYREKGQHFWHETGFDKD